MRTLSTDKQGKLLWQEAGFQGAVTQQHEMLQGSSRELPCVSELQHVEVPKLPRVPGTSRMLTFRDKLSTKVTKTLVHLRALLARELISMTRNPADVAGRMLTFTWIAIFVGLIYFSIPSTAESARLRLNVHYSNSCFFLLMPYVSMSLYTADRRYYLSDVSASLYHPLVYYIAKITATLPFNLLSAVAYCLIVHGMSGMRSDPESVVRATTLASLLSLIAVQVLHFAATVTPNQDTAFMLAIAWTALNLLMSNFFITYNEMSFTWISHLRWLSAQGYAFTGLSEVELGGSVFDCSEGIPEAQLRLLPALLPNTELVRSQGVLDALRSPGQGCTAHADAVLESFGHQFPFRHVLGILLGYLGVMHTATYVGLHLVSTQEQR